MTLIPAAAPDDKARSASLSGSRALARLKALGKIPRMNLSDREFLAPALEILETPPSPVHVAFLWIICAFVVAALAWAYFGRVDIVAAAQGKFQPMGQVKVVEPLETGKVEAINVSNGSLVQAGDVLVELDRSAALADAEGARAELASARAEILRRETALLSAQSHRFDRSRTIDWPDSVAPALRERENQVLAADLGQLAANVASFDAERAQKTAEGDKLRQTIETQKNLVATLQERVAMRTKLVEMKAGARAAVIDATETLQYQITQEAKQEQDLASLAAGLEVIARNADKAVEDFISENAQKLEDAERRAEDVEQRLAKAQAELDHLTLRAPIAGRVQSSIITNAGQVVTRRRIVKDRHRHHHRPSSGRGAGLRPHRGHGGWPHRRGRLACRTLAPSRRPLRLSLEPSEPAGGDRRVTLIPAAAPDDKARSASLSGSRALARLKALGRDSNE